MPEKYGLIGYPLTHSFSPVYFTNKFKTENIDAAYELYPLASVNEFPALLKNHPGIKGINVTIPYKETILEYLDEIDPIANKIKAVNCISIHQGLKKGYNTDAAGFKKSLTPLLEPYHKQALILGTGGAARAVAYVLSELNIDYVQVSRKRIDDILTYEELSPEIIDHSKLIINTTPLGMYPNTNEFPPIPYNSIGTHHLLYDLIYNPDETQFLSKGNKQGATIKNGLEMLKIQAEASWNIWNNYPTV
jgi:shikimate dehydrogenase